MPNSVEIYKYKFISFQNRFSQLKTVGFRTWLAVFSFFFWDIIPCILYSKACLLHAPVHRTLYFILYSEKKINIKKTKKNSCKKKDIERRKTISAFTTYDVWIKIYMNVILAKIAFQFSVHRVSRVTIVKQKHRLSLFTSCWYE